MKKSPTYTILTKPEKAGEIANKLGAGNPPLNLGKVFSTPLIKTGTAFDDPNYSPWDSVAHRLVTGRTDKLQEASEQSRAYMKLMKDHPSIKRKMIPADRLLKANDELINWLADGLTNAQMEKIESSKWTAFQECVLNDNIFTTGLLSDHALEFVQDPQPQIFLVQHEWAKLLKGASDEKGNTLDLIDFRLPYQRCIFEVRIASRRLVVMMDEDEAGEIQFIIAIDCGDCWFVGDRYPFKRFIKEYVQSYVESQNRAPDNYVLDNVAAMCICLEANVIEVEVTRAPHKLNAARTKQGKLPLPAHNTVSLARRYRITNPTGRTNSQSQGKVRLHFRRGHWRHYENHKTWIKWMLVGNPDLGFVEHEYRA